MKFILILLLLLPTSSCRSTTSAGHQHSSLAGVISQSPPGGTLIKRDVVRIDCSTFQEAVWYRMSRPVAAVIWHQYIGVRITSSANKKLIHEFETSGLSDPSDLQNLKSWWDLPGSSNKAAHMLEGKRYLNCKEFIASAKRVNAAMASSNYQNVGIRVLAMVIAPLPVLGGRPCAIEAESATKTWLDGSTAPEHCENCTEEIPNSKWSKTSVDWTTDAFSDGEVAFKK